MDKTAGILFAISSLPSKYGIGCFSKEAYKFVDWLVEAGQTFWQILLNINIMYRFIQQARPPAVRRASR